MQDLKTLQADGFLEIENIRHELKGTADALASVVVGENSFEIVVNGSELLLYSCGLHLESRSREDIDSPDALRKWLNAHKTQQ